MDLGDKLAYWALMFTASDEIQEEGSVRMSEEALRNKFSKMDRFASRSKRARTRIG